ncbi:MAG: hypothetical protein M1831_005864 [Alyxoria varia]|nr:MAG: hypothetical protein M1831_005864 [Alyxoria varia]
MLKEVDDAATLLEKTGFIQQTGICVNSVQILLRPALDILVLNGPIEGASKLSLSSVTGKSLWEKSDRLKDYGPELFRLKNRYDDKFDDDGLFLAPTHEEEITELVRQTVKTRKALPLRLYQISRKYRDERRPRQGLLRAKEFLMKDLYTFDVDETSALQTYSKVKEGYAKIFEDLKLPVTVAGADSGSMGGNLSHEFHVVSSNGEDTVVTCERCDYVANEEVAIAGHSKRSKDISVPIENVKCSMGITQDKALVLVFTENTEQESLAEDLKGLNVHAVKRALPELDTRVEHPIERWQDEIKARNLLPGGAKSLGRLTVVCESAVAHVHGDERELQAFRWIRETQEKFQQAGIPFPEIRFEKKVTTDESLAKVQEGGTCPQCQSPSLNTKNAIELGHTFHLGTRYSRPLELVLGETPTSNEKVPVSMGCHGIGISRIIGTVAALLSDDRGLNWPVSIAPYQSIIVASPGIEPALIDKVYDKLTRNRLNADGTEPYQKKIDTIIDDRSDSSFIQKLKDADLTGYPVIVVIGRQWSINALIEVQCRKLGKAVGVPLSNLQNTVKNFLDQL